MRDELGFPNRSGLGLMGGGCARDYLTRFLLERNKFVKQIAESEMWREYLSKAKPLRKTVLRYFPGMTR